MNVYSKAGASTVDAEIVQARDGGGFTAIASTTDLDRDNEVLAAGCMNPLPVSVPVHLGHTMSPADVVGLARPYYRGGQLMIDAKLASTPDAQIVRQKVADGVLDSISIVFRGLQWEDIDGVRTCVKGELLAADIVSVPSQPNARILSLRSWQKSAKELAHEVYADALLALARAEIAECKRMGYGVGGPARHAVDKQLRRILSDDTPATTIEAHFLRRSL